MFRILFFVLSLFSGSALATIDLVVTGITYSGGSFSATVQNNGSTSVLSGSTIIVRYVSDCVHRTWGSVAGPLASGASTTVPMVGGGYSLPTGTTPVLAYVDYDGMIAETNELNNTFLTSITVSSGTGNTIYVATTGNDSTGTGLIGAPYATIQKAHDVAVAGDTIILRAGTYTPTAQTNLTKSGTTNNLITLTNFTGETVTIDGVSSGAGSDILRFNSASYWYVKGLNFFRASRNAIRLEGASNNNTFERNVISNSGNNSTVGTGLQIVGTSANNLVLNNDSHHNHDTTVGGGNSDGFSAQGLGNGNVFRGNRAWKNGDDGFDYFNRDGTASSGPVLVESNWSFENGFDDAYVAQGDGNAFKLGGSIDSETVGKSGGHTVRNNVAWGNKHRGFDQNGASIPITIYNNTSYNNAVANFNFSSGSHILKNNINYGTNGAMTGVSDTFNSWNLSVTVNSADFTATPGQNDTCARSARQSDGSLPVCNNFKLVAGSDLIDKGTPVGISYLGAAPDLGAYELQ